MTNLKNNFILYLFIAIFFCGCSFFNEPVNEFFRRYTDDAAVIDHRYSESLVQDRYGIDCLPSGHDQEIFLYLRNPQLFEFDLDIVSDYENSSGGTIDQSPETYSIVQQYDRTVLKIILRKDFLTALECGGIFSPTVSLVESETKRKFEDYHFDLKINSVPPVPQEAVVLVTSSVPKKYVLCFNLPDTQAVKSIHRDVKTVTIESNGSVGKRKIYLTPDAGGNISLSDESGHSVPGVVKSVSPGDITENNDAGAAGLSFTPGSNPVYVFTGDSLVPIANNIFYKITLEDEDGLSSNTTTSVYSQKLKSPTATAVKKSDDAVVQLDDVTPQEIVQNADGAAYVRIVLPKESTSGLPVSSCSVDYEIYGGSSFDVLLGNGTVNSDREIPVPPVECKIKAMARNTSYVSSDAAWFHVRPVCTKLYVSSSGSAGGWGTKSSPFNKISTAVGAEIFTDSTYPENMIVLLSDIRDENININTKMNLTVSGQNSNGAASVHSITPVSASSSFMTVDAESEVNMENLCIKNFASSSSGGAISVGDAMLYLNNVELSRNSSSMNGGALYLSGDKSRVTFAGNSKVHSNIAAEGNGAYVDHEEAVLVVKDASYFALQDEIYLRRNAMLYASSLCTAQKIACLKPETYPEDPVVNTVKLLASCDMNRLDGDFCNMRVTIAPNESKPELDYYVVYSESLRCGILATGTSANIKTPLPDKVIFRQLYIKGVPMTFYTTDGYGNKINPQDSSIKIMLRNDVLAQGSKSNGYARVQIPHEIESQIQDGKIGIDTVLVELSIRVSGIVYSAKEDLVATTEIKDVNAFAMAADLINTLEDSSGINLEISEDFEVDDTTPLLGCDENHKFNGTVDGQGHTITIKKTVSNGDSRRTAIADRVGPAGVIKNVIVGGGYDYNPYPVRTIELAAIAVENEGLIINCVNYLDCTVNSCSDVGGIVVRNRKTGRIINCANFGNITNRNTIYWAMVNGLMGGIAGKNSGVIENCFNYGTVKSTVNYTVTSCANALPGAIVGAQNHEDGSAGSGNHCYWKTGCVKKNCGSEGAAYDSYAFKNSLYSFFWSYGTKGVNCSIDGNKKSNETLISSCGTFDDATSSVQAGTDANSERTQILQYNGTLLEVMNGYVTGHSNKYRFNGNDIDLGEWESDALHDGYPKIKF